MCVWKQFIIFICITPSAWAQQQNGGSLHCPVEWFNGSTIRLKFLINETLFPSVCTSGTDYRPYFQRKTSASDPFSSNCTVPDIRTSCGSFDPDDLGCGCVGKNGSYILQYNFIAHGDYDGFWGADIRCPDASANPLLTFSANSCDNKRVKNDPCDGYLCKRGGVCSVNNTGGPTCSCSGTYHSGDQCTYNACANYSGPATCAVSDSNPSKAIYICKHSWFVKGYKCAELTWLAWVGICALIVFVVVLFLLVFVTLKKKVKYFDPRHLRLTDTLKVVPVLLASMISCKRLSIHIDICVVMGRKDRMVIIMESRNLFMLWYAEWQVGRLLDAPKTPATSSEPAADYSMDDRTAHSNEPAANNSPLSQPKKSKSDKAIPLSSVGRSSPPSETSGDEKTHMIPPTKGRALPVPANQHEPTSTGIGKSASPRLDPLTQDHSKMTSVERNSGAFPRKLPSPGQPPLDPIPSGKKS